MNILEQHGIDEEDLRILKGNAVHGMFQVKEGTSCNLGGKGITFYLGEFESGGDAKCKMKITVDTEAPFAITVYTRQGEGWTEASVDKAKLAEKTAVLMHEAAERMRAIRKEVNENVDKKMANTSAAANALLDELI